MTRDCYVDFDEIEDAMVLTEAEAELGLLDEETPEVEA